MTPGYWVGKERDSADLSMEHLSNTHTGLSVHGGLWWQWGGRKGTAEEKRVRAGLGYI